SGRHPCPPIGSKRDLTARAGQHSRWVTCRRRYFLFTGGRPRFLRQGKGDYPIACQSWWRPRCSSAQRLPASRLRPGVAALLGAGEVPSFVHLAVLYALRDFACRVEAALPLLAPFI